MLLAVPRFKHGSSPWTILTVYAIPISVLGLQLNTSTLVLGSTGRVVPMAPSDDTTWSGREPCFLLMGWKYMVHINHQCILCSNFSPDSPLHVGAWTYLEMKALSPGSTGQSISKHRSFHFNQLPEKPLASTRPWR